MNKPTPVRTRKTRVEPAPGRTPSVARREREKEETRALILSAARAMFTKQGYERTTMRGIADGIGYTATAIYHHFADKHALMLELCATDFRALGYALTTAGSIADPVERIRLMGINYVRFALEHPEQFRFMFLIERPTPSPDEMAPLDPDRGGYLFLKAAVAQAIETRRFRGEFTDPDMVAQILWATVHGIATIHVTATDEKRKWLDLRSSSQTAEVACTVLLHGLLRE